MLIVIVSGCTQSSPPEGFEWCVVGESWSVGVSQIQGEIVEVTTYQGEWRCHISVATGAVTLDMYILDEQGNDIWFVAIEPQLGTITFHIVNGQCTGDIMVCTWWDSFVLETQPQTQLCAINTLYNIESAKFNFSGENNLWLKITNVGTEELYGFGVIMDNGTQIIVMNSTNPRIDQSNISPSNKLKKGQSIYLRTNLTNRASDPTDYEVFGLSLTTSDYTEIVVTNEACSAIATEAITNVDIV